MNVYLKVSIGFETNIYKWINVVKSKSLSMDKRCKKEIF